MKNGTIQEVKPWLFDLQLHGGKAGGDPDPNPNPGDPDPNPNPGDPDPNPNPQPRTYDEAYVTRLRREKADAEKKAKDLEKAEQDRIAAEAQEKDDQKKLAKLEKDRADKLQKQLDEVTTKGQQRIINAELRSLAREMGLLDLDDLKLLDKTGLEVTEDDEVIGAKELIEKFKTDKPHKFKAAKPEGDPDPNPQPNPRPAPKNPPKPSDRNPKPKDAKDMNDEEFEDSWSKAGKQ